MTCTVQAPGMIRQNQTPDGASAGTPSPDNTPCACKNKTCQGGLSTVDSHGLAVLHPGFKRDRMASWRETSIFTDNGAESTVEQQHNLKDVSFLSFSDIFTQLVGSEPYAEVLAQQEHEFAHEGPVHLAKTNEVFFTSNQLGGGSTGQPKHVALYAVKLDTGAVRHIETSDPVPFANGAVAYKDGIALLAQGHQDRCPGGVLFLDPYSGQWHWLINNWFGLAFNSPNDIVYTAFDQALWFTDPTYAANQGFKGKPQLGEYVWRYVPGGPPARVVADGFERPNGLAISADQHTMYVSDTGLESGNPNQELDARNPHTIYAYDILRSGGGSFLANRRLFAVCDSGIPDGVKLDRDGNVYSGCGDGLNIWAPSGDLIGKIHVEGGVSNFCFADNDLILLAETRVLKIKLSCEGKCTGD